ncbi:MAG: sulfate permease [Candidatus Omnitrophica bacterium]|nr:sulfate permease [Candidatus Omnitrophota bacterium]
MGRNKLKPKLITVLKEGYSIKKFVPDLIAGIIVGIVALPLAIAFAIASGVKPEQGLYTAVVAGLIISCLSGSRVQIGGPTGAFIVIVYGIVSKYGYDGLATATLMAGFLLILMGIARFGDIIKYIPYPVTVGFTGGIALIIFAAQIRDFLGLTGGAVPAEFIEKIQYYMVHINTMNMAAVWISILTLLIIVYWPKVTRRIPGSFIAIILTTAIVQIFHLPIETIGSRFGGVPNTLPMPHLPHISLELIEKMSSPALTIAILAGIESLLSAVVADGMTGNRHRSNMELIAQGVANIASPIMGGIPATGAIARTATNIKNGGRTPFAGIIHAITLLLILIFFGPWASLIPMATLAGILISVAYNMSEWHLFVKIFRSPKSDIIVLLTTFLLTVFIDLTVAIKFGVVLAALLFMRRMSEATQVGYITDSIADQETDEEDMIDQNRISQKDVPEEVEVFEIHGPFFFGAADKFKDTIRGLEKKPKVLILRMRHVPTIDATGLSALENVFNLSKQDGTQIILSGLQPRPLGKIRRSGLLKSIETKNIQPTIDHAINRAKEILKENT